MRRALALLAFVAAWFFVERAYAQAPAFDVGVLGGPSTSSFLVGAVELYARIDNPTDTTLSGTFAVRGQREGEQVIARSDFSVGPKSVGLVRLPVATEDYVLFADLTVGSVVVLTKPINSDDQDAYRIFDVDEPSRVRAVMDGTTIPRPYPSSSPSRSVRVSSPPFDPATGSPILPTFVASWHGTTAVIISAGTLAALSAEELEALAGYVAGGGTLAVVIERPEDLRESVVARFVGGEPSPDQLRPGNVRNFDPPMSPGERTKLESEEEDPPLPVLASYDGGNLEPSVFGANATYGLGEVILLGFNPRDAAVAPRAWTKVRMAELIRRAYDRGSVGSVHPGRANRGPGYAVPSVDSIIETLDPNAAGKWSIAVAALLLCVYAVVAGPISFQRATKKKRPIAALALLPVLSAGTFVLVVLVGFFSKGLARKANRLTYVEVGAGMPVGVARQHRAFFSAFSQEISIRPSRRTNLVDLAGGDSSPCVLVSDGDGMRVEGLTSTPSQTVLFREEGLFSLGGTIDVERGPGDAVLVRNGTAFELRGVIMRLPDGTFRFRDVLAPGASASSDDLGAGNPRFLQWTENVRNQNGAALHGEHLRFVLSDEKGMVPEELAPIWAAVEQTSSGNVSWFPPGTPVVLATAMRTDASEDSGIDLDRDYLAVRVVGFGSAAP